MRMWMRWTACTVGVGLGLVPLTSRAAEYEEFEKAPEVRRTLVMALPVSGLSGQVGVGVEHAVGSHVALAGAAQALASFTGNEFYNPEGVGFSNRRWGVGVDAGVHFYVSGRAPEGFWVGPHVEMSMVRQSIEDIGTIFAVDADDAYVWSSRMVEYGGSARLGYTAIVAPGLTVQVGAGLAALVNRSSNFTPKGGPPAGGSLGGVSGGLAPSNFRSWTVAPRMTVGLGWAF